MAAYAPSLRLAHIDHVTVFQSYHKGMDHCDQIRLTQVQCLDQVQLKFRTPSKNDSQQDFMVRNFTFFPMKWQKFALT